MGDGGAGRRPRSKQRMASRLRFLELTGDGPPLVLIPGITSPAFCRHSLPSSWRGPIMPCAGQPRARASDDAGPAIRGAADTAGVIASLGLDGRWPEDDGRQDRNPMAGGLSRRNRHRWCGRPAGLRPRAQALIAAMVSRCVGRPSAARDGQFLGRNAESRPSRAGAELHPRALTRGSTPRTFFPIFRGPCFPAGLCRAGGVVAERDADEISAAMPQSGRIRRPHARRVRRRDRRLSIAAVGRAPVIARHTRSGTAGCRNRGSQWRERIHGQRKAFKPAPGVAVGTGLPATSIAHRSWRAATRSHEATLREPSPTSRSKPSPPSRLPGAGRRRHGPGP